MKENAIKYITGVLLMMGLNISAQSEPLVGVVWQQSDVLNAVGGATGNAIIQGLDPFGNTSPLFETTSANANYSGFKFENINISTDKTYRFSYWIKATNITDPKFAGYVKCHTGNCMSTPSGVSSNYIYITKDWRLPSANQWYLVVSYIKGIQDSNTYQGQIVDQSSNSVVPSYQGNAWSSSPSTIWYHVFMYNTTNTSDKIYVFDPRIEEVSNGNDSVDDLLNPTPTSTGGSTVWTTSGNDIYYSAGNVGIGTTTPGSYKLAVNGNIRSKEVLVETANWPDYVFKKGYELPSLEDVQRHIREKGHLPNIPSAIEAEANGVELGEMNRLLLEKVEELTLYAIQLKEEISNLSKKNNSLQQRMERLERLVNNKSLK